MPDRVAREAPLRRRGRSKGPGPGRRRPRGRREPQGRAARWARPFLLSTALLVVLVVLHGGLHGGHGVLGRHEAPSVQIGRRSSSSSSLADDIDCRLVHGADDPCAFVRQHCDDEAAGLLPYLELYYCGGGGGGGGLRAAAAFGVLVAWLGLLFTTIGIAASDFFSVNLGTIARILGLSESLAGVTFLAFGNGSPDVFSTFAAMGSNSGSMAIGELIGAAGFITAVVAGSMALVREFRVSRRTFVRDILFFIAAVAFAMVFLADGRLAFWECCVMIAFYGFYVLTVVGWHWISTRRRRRRLREAAARATVFADDDDGDNHAPYHDDPANDHNPGDSTNDDPDDTAPVGRRRRRRPSPDISALERGPRIAVQSVDSVSTPWRNAGAPASPTAPTDAAAAASAAATGSPSLQPLLRSHHHLRHHHRARHDDEDAEDAEDAEERRNRQIAAEMKSSMRVNMPGGRRGTASSTMATPIRPSLLGVLEFRSVLASLQRSGTVRLGPLDAHGRRRPSQQLQQPPPPLPPLLGPLSLGPPALSRGHSMSVVDGSRAAAAASAAPARRGSMLPPAHPYLAAPAVGGRDRAFSSGDVPAPRAAQPVDGAQDTGPLLAGVASPPLAAGPGAPLHLEIPGPAGASSSPGSSPALSPFPGYTESPLPVSPAGGPGHPGLSSRVSSFGLAAHPEEDTEEEAEARHSVSAADTASYPGLGEEHEGEDGRRGLHTPRPVRWWPYRVLPPPHVLTRTFFPSLSGWREKTAWDRFVSLISVPTVFLLVLTLPVVELEDDDEEGDDDDNNDAMDHLLHDVVDDPIEAAYAEPAGARLAASATALNEWQRYRRSTNASSGGGGGGFLVPPPREADASSSTAVSMRSVSTADEPPPPAEAGPDGEVPAIPSTLDNPPAKPRGPALGTAEAVDAAGAPPHDANTAAAAAAAATATAAAATGWHRWRVAVQLVAGPLFTVSVAWANMADELGARAGRVLALLVAVSLAGSAALVAALVATTTAAARAPQHTAAGRRWDGLLCFLGFVISVAWISTVAGEVVGVLKAVGVIAGISEAILGLTVFAVGNSLGDLVADLTVARLGYPVMALSACFGGPMLNILLGVGIGGAWVTTQAARDREHRHPGEPRHYAPYRIAVGSSLLVSAVTVLVTLVVLLVAVPANGWVMSRRIGLALIALWAVSTVGNVVMEVTGGW